MARKLAVLCWHLLSKDADYQWARPALVASKIRAMQLQAGQPARKGNKRGAAYAYNSMYGNLAQQMMMYGMYRQFGAPGGGNPYGGGYYSPPPSTIPNRGGGLYP